MAIKLHFSQVKFDVFATGGRIKCKRSTFLARRDVKIFEGIAKQYPEDKQCIQFFASNFMYRNPNVLFDRALSVKNFNQYTRIKQAITHTFINDISIIVNAEQTCDIPTPLSLFLSDQITLETISILNTMSNFSTELRQNQHLNVMLGDVLLLIEKSRGFVIFSRDKIQPIYDQYIKHC